LRDALASFLPYDTSPRWPGVLLELWAQAIRNPEVSKRLTEAYASWRKQLVETFDAAGAAGLITATSDDAAAVTLAAHDGFAVQNAIGSPGGKTMTAADLAESLLQPLETVAATRSAAAR
jgi:hypothetical protein